MEKKELKQAELGNVNGGFTDGLAGILEKTIKRTPEPTIEFRDDVFDSTIDISEIIKKQGN